MAVWVNLMSVYGRVPPSVCSKGVKNFMNGPMFMDLCSTVSMYYDILSERVVTKNCKTK